MPYMTSQSELQPLILHAFASSPNPLKIGIALEILKVPYKIQIWDFGDDPRKGVKSENFTALNENGKVPVLEDPNTGVTSWESGAIMNYLRRVYDEDGRVLGLSGKGSGAGGEVTEQDKADFEKWDYLLLTSLGPMTGQMVWFRHFQYPKNPEALDRYEKQVYRCYDVLEGQLAKTDSKSILPGGLTAVDVQYYPWVRQTDFLGVSHQRYPFIKKWVENMGAIKAFNAAYDKLQEAAKLEGVANADESGNVLGADKGLLRSIAAGLN